MKADTPTPDEDPQKLMDLQKIKPLRRGVPSLFLLLSLGAIVVSFLQNLFTFLAFFPKLSFGIFKNGIPKVYSTNRVNVTPSAAFYGIVPISGFLQLLWTTYSLLSLFRRVPSGAAILNPPVLSASFFFFYIIGTLFNVGWLFLFDRSFLFEAGIVDGVISIFHFPAYCIAATRLFYYRKELSESKRYADMFVYKWFVLNGIAMQWAYTIVSFIIHLTVLLSLGLSTPPSVETASIISLGVLALLMVAYTVSDVTAMQPIFRGVISPYIVVLWSLGSILRNNWQPSNLSTLVTMCLMTSTLVSLVLKTSITVYNNRLVK